MILTTGTPAVSVSLSECTEGRSSADSPRWGSPEKTGGATISRSQRMTEERYKHLAG